jgi:hypothetical protein
VDVNLLYLIATNGVHLLNEEIQIVSLLDTNGELNIPLPDESPKPPNPSIFRTKVREQVETRGPEPSGSNRHQEFVILDVNGDVGISETKDRLRGNESVESVRYGSGAYPKHPTDLRQTGEGPIPHELYDFAIEII